MTTLVATGTSYSLAGVVATLRRSRPSAIAWATIEDAIHAWVTSGSGLQARKVVWDHWKAPRPMPPFIELAISESHGIGHDWRTYDDAPDSAPGAELRVRSRGHRTAMLVLQAFGVPERGQAARPLLEDVVSALPLNEYALDVGGVGVGDLGPVTSIDGKRGGVLEPRARCQVSLHLGSEIEGRETYIERFQLTVREVTNEPPVTVASFWTPTDPL